MTIKGLTVSTGKCLVKIEDESLKVFGIGDTINLAIKDAIDRFNRSKYYNQLK